MERENYFILLYLLFIIIVKYYKDSSLWTEVIRNNIYYIMK